MAASRARLFHAVQNLRKERLLHNKIYFRSFTHVSGILPQDVLSSKAPEFSGKRIEILENPSVQTILKRMTGMNFNKIFKPRREALQNPVYKVLDREEYEKVNFLFSSILSKDLKILLKKDNCA